MERNAHCFHLPVRPYSPIDALNRSAAALGSPRYGAAAAHADYNGHHVSLSWNDYRSYYVAEYYWAGRMVIARGRFADCLRAVLAEYNRGALGASASVSPRPDDTEAIALCEATPDLAPGAVAGEWMEGNRPAWYTWRHECAAASARDYANPRGLVMVFDWDVMQASATREEYETALRAKHGRVYQ